MFNTIFKGTLLSILIFFSTSFLTVLFQINSPLNRREGYSELNIGFPFKYYHEFIVDCPTPNYGWDANNLINDCILIWVLTISVMMINKTIKTSSETK